MKVEFDISSMQHGARRAGVVSSAIADTAGRVGGLPTPEGTPPDVVGQLRAISGTLGRASRSMGSQVGWLSTHAQLAKLADSPLGAFVWLFSPPLLSPFPPPKVAKPKPKEKNPWGPDFLWDAGSATVDAAKDTAVGTFQFGKGFVVKGGTTVLDLGKLAMVMSAPPGMPLADWDPRKKWRHDYAVGLKWAAKNPGEFARAVGGSLIAEEEHKEHGHAYGAGANTFDVISMFFGVGELAAAAKGAKAVTAGTRAAPSMQRATTATNTARFEADLARDTPLHPQRPGESNAAFRLRERAHQADIDSTKARADAAKTIEDEIRRRIDRSNVQAAEAELKLRRAMQKTPAELAVEVAKNIRNNTATELPKHVEDARREGIR